MKAAGKLGGRYSFNKVLYVVLLLLLSGILTPLLITSSSASGDEIMVGVYQNPPLVLKDEDEITGLYIDILEYIAEEEGWNIVYEFDTFPNLIQKLRAGQIDLMTAIAFSEEREEIFDFNSETIISNWGVICAFDSIDSILDLEGLRIATIRNDIYHEKLRKMLDEFELQAEFVIFDGDYPDVCIAVQNGAADCCVVSRLFAQFCASDYGLKQTNIIFAPVSLRFAAPAGEGELLAVIDTHLNAMKDDADSIYYHSLEKWIGFSGEESIPDWLLYPLIILPIVIGTVLGWNYSLRRALAKKTAKLLESKEMLELLNKTLRHDILNDITVISGNLELFKETGDSKFLEHIVWRLKKAEKLINNLRELERSTRYDELEQVNLRELISEITGEYHIPINVKGDCRVMCNRAIESALTNIIENAIIHGKTDRIDISIKRIGGQCELRIIDYGTGIPDDIKEKIFSEGISYGGGSGYGLFIAKKIVELNGGRIWVEDNSPHGTVFVIRLKAV